MFETRLCAKTIRFPVPAVAGPEALNVGDFVRYDFVVEARYASAGTLESIEIGLFPTP